MYNTDPRIHALSYISTKLNELKVKTLTVTCEGEPGTFNVVKGNAIEAPSQPTLTTLYQLSWRALGAVLEQVQTLAEADYARRLASAPESVVPVLDLTAEERLDYLQTVRHAIATSVLADVDRPTLLLGFTHLLDNFNEVLFRLWSDETVDTQEFIPFGLRADDASACCKPQRRPLDMLENFYLKLLANHLKMLCPIEG